MFLELTEIFAGANATRSVPWRKTDFRNVMIFANGNDDTITYDGTTTGVIPGLLEDELRWDGVTSYANHVILWRGNQLRGSASDDYTNWFLIGRTSGTSVIKPLEPFIQPEVGGSIQFFTADEPLGWAKGTLVRIDMLGTPSYFNFYQVESVSPIGGFSIQTIGATQTIPDAEHAKIFTAATPSFLTNSFVKFGLTKFEVLGNSSKFGFVGSLASGFSKPIVNGLVSVTLNEDIIVAPGDYINIAPNTTTASIPGQDIYKVVAIEQPKTLLIMRVGVGTDQVDHDTNDNIIFQPWVDADAIDGAYTTSAAQVISEAYKVTLTLQDTAGNSPSSTEISAVFNIEPMPANDAFKWTGAGGVENSNIKMLIQGGDNIYIFRDRSIASMQYVGRPEIYNIRNEVADEGLLGKGLILRVGMDEIYFWGHKEFYRFSGGQLTPVAQQVSKNILLNEFSQAIIDEYRMVHNESQKEVWTIYRPFGATSTKIMIYNYLEDSCVFDEWPQDINYITAAGALNFGDNGRKILLATNKNDINNTGPGLLICGDTYSWQGEDIISEAETADMDCGDARTFKYIDTVYLDLQIKSQLPTAGFRLYCSIGARDNLDSPVRWNSGRFVDVQGGGQAITRIDAPISGRFIRLKFSSSQANCIWRIASYTLTGRFGGLY